MSLRCLSFHGSGTILEEDGERVFPMNFVLYIAPHMDGNIADDAARAISLMIADTRAAEDAILGDN